MSHVEHRASAPASIRCFVLTISDTRTEETDASGQAIVSLLTDAGHEVVGRAIVRDEPADVRRVVEEQLGNQAVQAIVSTGGTGISARDTTFEAIDGLLEKRLEGFGELFRMLSFQEVGPAAMLSRACAGLASGKIVVALPGSENAVRLAVTKLIVPELRHLVLEASR